jgi:hypothetical protein
MMGDSLHEQLQKLNATIDKLEQDASSAQMMDGNVKRAEAEKIVEALEKWQRHFQVLDTQVRLLPVEERARWNSDIRAMKIKLKNVQVDLKWAKSPDEVRVDIVPEVTEEKVIAVGDGLIAGINKSTAETLRMIKEAEDLAIRTAEQIKAQGEQLQEFDKDLFEIDDTLKRATVVTKRMARNVLTDRYLWALTVLIILIIITVVALKATGHSLTNSFGNA